jgi:hypothetical protein
MKQSCNKKEKKTEQIYIFKREKGRKKIKTEKHFDK